MPADSPVAVVTGSSSGIGFGTATRLADAGWHVLVHARDDAKAQAAVARARRQHPSGFFEPISGDLADLGAVFRLARQIQDRTTRLDALVNNAGVATPNRTMHRRGVTADGYQLEWQVNFLAPFTVTLLLSDLLVHSAPARVVNVSSVAQGWGEIHWSDLQLERKWDRMTAYAQSKLALTMFTNESARRMAGTGVTANSLHPGMCYTRMVRATFLFAPRSATYGARNVARLVLDPDLRAVTGCYMHERQLAAPNGLADDRTACGRLWRIAARQTGISADRVGIVPTLVNDLIEHQ